MAYLWTRGVDHSYQPPGIHIGDPAPEVLDALGRSGLPPRGLGEARPRRKHTDHLACRCESLFHAFCWYDERRAQLLGERRRDFQGLFHLPERPAVWLWYGCRMDDGTMPGSNAPPGPNVRFLGYMDIPPPDLTVPLDRYFLRPVPPPVAPPGPVAPRNPQDPREALD